MMGRSGRPGYDPVGDAYVLLPQKTFELHKERLKKPQPIKSQMLDDIGGRHKVLAFHLVSEIHQGNIKNNSDVKHWYKRSLAAFQSYDLDEKVVEDTMELLKKCGAVWEEEGEYSVTSVGKISSIFYYSPFDVADLKRNFNWLFDNHKEDNDTFVSVALGNVDTQRCGIVSRAEREQMSGFASLVDRMFGHGVVQESSVKAAYAYHLSLNGRNDPVFAGFTRGLQFDFQRLVQVLHALDGFTGKWGRKDWFRRLGLRVLYGVKGDMVHLCEIPQVGRVRATKLWQAGLKTIEDVANNPSKVKVCLGVKADLLQEIISGAKALLLTS
jgi:helicase